MHKDDLACRSISFQYALTKTCHQSEKIRSGEILFGRDQYLRPTHWLTQFHIISCPRQVSFKLQLNTDDTTCWLHKRCNAEANSVLSCSLRKRTVSVYILAKTTSGFNSKFSVPPNTRYISLLSCTQGKNMANSSQNQKFTQASKCRTKYVQKWHLIIICLYLRYKQRHKFKQ